MIKALLARTNDRITLVKIHAIKALCRLQDPADADDKVTARFVELLDKDPLV